MTKAEVDGRPQVRPAGAADADAVRRVIVAAYEQFRPAVPASLFERYVEELTDLDARHEAGSELLVADVDGEVVGTVTYYPDAATQGLGWPSGWAGFRALAVAPSARGLGTGRQLVGACIDRARAAGAPTLCLHTAELMTAAISIYEDLDFVRAPSYDITPRDVLALDDDIGPPVIAYRLDLI
jgi:predicted N-acetyltransferase YhbS